MTEAARAGMNQRDNLFLLDLHCGCSIAIMHLLDVLHFEEMISATERTELGSAALLRSIGNFVRQRGLERSAGFGELRIACLAVTIGHHPAGAFAQHVI